MNNLPSYTVWNDTALALVREHGSHAVDYCVRRMHALVEQGQEKEALVWIEIAFATSDLIARMKSEPSTDQ